MKPYSQRMHGVLPLQLAQWFLFLLLSPLVKGLGFYLNKFVFPFQRYVLSQVGQKLVQWFWQSQNHEKFTDRQQVNRKHSWAFSSGELKTQTELLLR